MTPHISSEQHEHGGGIDSPARTAALAMVDKYQNELRGALYSPHNNISAIHCAIMECEARMEEISKYSYREHYMQRMEEIESILTELQKLR